MSDLYIEDRDLSVAWGRALARAARDGKEVGSLIVSVTGFDENIVEETAAIRSALEGVLQAKGKQTVETVANTIFPLSLWNPAADRAQLFERYTRVLPKLRKASTANRYGLYFERMITAGPKGQPNQLEHAIGTYTARSGVRRSALQVATFDPNRDHTTAAFRGFPCLQHVTFAPSDGGLNVNAFYATQYLVERGYGNYLGLCRLGAFVAHELKLPLQRFTCLVGVGQIQGKISKLSLRPIFAALDEVLAAREGDEEDEG
jgi:thymidylate synthase